MYLPANCMINVYFTILEMRSVWCDVVHYAVRGNYNYNKTTYDVDMCLIMCFFLEIDRCSGVKQRYKKQIVANH